MSSNYAPLVRVFLRYFVGAAIMGSPDLAERWATDPDVIIVGSVFIGLVTEGFYWLAKKRGWNT